MTKEEIKERLWRGGKFSDIFPFRKNGQECEIFKAPWPEKAISENRYKVVYVPDISLNDIDGLVDKEHPDLNEIQELLASCCTVNDFLYQAYGNIKAAKALYDFVDWQHPEIQDLKDCTDDGEALADYGETWESMEERAKGIEETRKELYRLYQLEWMASHGYSVQDILNECNKLLYNFVQDGTTLEDDPEPNLDFESSGFGGSLWVCFDEFLDGEYQDDGYICGLYGYVKDYIGKDRGRELERWYQTDIGNYRDMRVMHYLEDDTELAPMIMKDR